LINIEHFKEKARDQVQSIKGTEIEILRIFGHFKEKCHQVNKFSFTGFFAHFKVLPVRPPQDVDVLAVLDFQIPCFRPDTSSLHPRSLLTNQEGHSL